MEQQWRVCFLTETKLEEYNERVKERERKEENGDSRYIFWMKVESLYCNLILTRCAYNGFLAMQFFCVNLYGSVLNLLEERMKKEMIEEMVMVGGLVMVQFVYAGNSLLMSYLMSLGLGPFTIVIFSTFATFIILSPFAILFERFV